MLDCTCGNTSSKNAENKLLLVKTFPDKAAWEGQKWQEHGAFLFLGWTG